MSARNNGSLKSIVTKLWQTIYIYNPIWYVFGLISSIACIYQRLIKFNLTHNLSKSQKSTIIPFHRKREDLTWLTVAKL